MEMQITIFGIGIGLLLYDIVARIAAKRLMAQSEATLKETLVKVQESHNNLAKKMMELEDLAQAHEFMLKGMRK